jgi:hypothetical protein
MDKFSFFNTRMDKEPEINTIIGGMAFLFPNAEAFVVNSSLELSDIKRFEIKGEDVRLHISKDWTNNINFRFVSTQEPDNAEAITCYIDLDGHNVLQENEMFRGANVKFIYTPKLSVSSYRGYGDNGPLKVLYTPLEVPFSGSSGNNQCFSVFNSKNTTKCRLYSNIANETILNGSADGDFSRLLSNGGSIVYKDLDDTSQNTKPDRATNLSISNITQTTCEFSFNTPTHLNSFSYYVVFIDDEFHNIYPISNNLIENLQPNKTQSINILIADSFFNLSHFSNKATFTTL